ncbi:MAG: fumarylacetoacetase [Mycobacteriales bacterium]
MSNASWVAVPDGSSFPIENLPYGVFTARDPAGPPRVGVAIGEQVLDLTGLAAAERAGWAPSVGGPTLNPLLAAGPETWREVRRWVGERLRDPKHRSAVEHHLRPQEEVQLHLPVAVADYVDFYSSEQHVTNVGRIFRPHGPPLPPSWRHQPAGYHGRAGTVVVSGTPVVRPCGQRRSSETGAESGPTPSIGPSRRLDFEAEVGFVVGVPSSLGERVPTGRFADHVFGALLVNDWSARDIQAWESVPLGPFLGKSFATSVSPWLVPLEALNAARVSPPPHDEPPLPYLQEVEPWGLDLQLEVEWNGTVVARPPFAGMYWTPAQQLAHLTSNGASLRTGDLYASGTVSGARRDQWGSLLELTWNGTVTISHEEGASRTFLEDGDTLTIRASAPGADGSRIGFGAVTGTVLPAINDGGGAACSTA